MKLRKIYTLEKKRRFYKLQSELEYCKRKHSVVDIFKCFDSFCKQDINVISLTKISDQLNDLYRLMDKIDSHRFTVEMLGIIEPHESQLDAFNALKNRYDPNFNNDEIDKYQGQVLEFDSYNEAIGDFFRLCNGIEDKMNELDKLQQFIQLKCDVIVTLKNSNVNIDKLKQLNMDLYLYESQLFIEE